MWDESRSQRTGTPAAPSRSMSEPWGDVGRRLGRRRLGRMLGPITSQRAKPLTEHRRRCRAKPLPAPTFVAIWSLSLMMRTRTPRSARGGGGCNGADGDEAGCREGGCKADHPATRQACRGKHAGRAKQGWGAVAPWPPGPLTVRCMHRVCQLITGQGEHTDLGFMCGRVGGEVIACYRGECSTDG
jgi:hypothetical protein